MAVTVSYHLQKILNIFCLMYKTYFMLKIDSQLYENLTKSYIK